MSRYNDSLDAANEALAAARKIKQRYEIAACYRVMARAHAALEHHDKAKALFADAIDLFERIGARYELAVTRYHAATSGLYPYEVSSAMLHLAERYFEEQELTRWMERLTEATTTLESKARQSAETLGSHTQVTDGPPVIIAESKVMRDVMQIADRMAPTNLNILLTGETGTGKDLLARYIHHRSGRAGELVTVNAAAIPDDMIEAELFGHTRGAFTGAERERKGLLEYAHGGTFFLNEVGDASPKLQAKLLEVIETRTIRKLGQNESRRVSFRFIAATNRDLRKDIERDNFRRDLYHRISEMRLHLPSLHQRQEELESLIRYFLKREGVGLSNGAGSQVDRLIAIVEMQEWPGNVRQLASYIRRIAVHSDKTVQSVADGALAMWGLNEDDVLQRVLDRTHGNRSEAARILGVAESTIRNRMEKLT